MQASPDSAPARAPTRWLALDSSTGQLSVAVGAAGAATPLAQAEGAGGPQASSTLLPTIRNLLQQVGWTLAELDGIVFGRGPGSFTGLRTACAVAQGLAVAARPGGIPVLPVDTLLAVAEAARHHHAPQAPVLRVVAALDARMDEVYAAVYDWDAHSGWRTHQPPLLCPPEALDSIGHDSTAAVLRAGNVRAVYGARLGSRWHTQAIDTHPQASALLRLAAALQAAGQCVPAEQALPLYVRDKVALTRLEQEALRAQRGAA
jgi:tRNA threonylcarbamoyladenosine biosynthesis protein TsaB